MYDKICNSKKLENHSKEQCNIIIYKSKKKNNIN